MFLFNYQYILLNYTLALTSRSLPLWNRCVIFTYGINKWGTSFNYYMFIFQFVAFEAASTTFLATVIIPLRTMYTSP